MWAAIDNGTYAHIFTKLDKPYKMVGQLIRWHSICGRLFAIDKPKPNTKKKKCSYCLDMENGHHGGEK